MLISQGHKEPLQCFSFEGGVEIQQQEPRCSEGKQEHADSIPPHQSEITEAS